MTAKLWIREYTQVVADRQHGVLAGKEPGLDQDPITITGTSAPSARFQDSTVFVRVKVSGGCSFVIGTGTPVATANNAPLGSGATEYFGIAISGMKLAVIENTDV